MEEKESQKQSETPSPSSSFGCFNLSGFLPPVSLICLDLQNIWNSPSSFLLLFILPSFPTISPFIPVHVLWSHLSLVSTCSDLLSSAPLISSFTRNISQGKIFQWASRPLHTVNIPRYGYAGSSHVSAAGLKQKWAARNVKVTQLTNTESESNAAQAHNPFYDTLFIHPQISVTPPVKERVAPSSAWCLTHFKAALSFNWDIHFQLLPSFVSLFGLVWTTFIFFLLILVI